MAPVNPGSYIFDPQSITKIRNMLHLTQKQMSEKLGVPINTLSRWETGATTLDANSLAAIHSLAVSQGYTPGFFRKASAVTATATQMSKGKVAQQSRQRVIVMLDFQNVGVRAQSVSKLTDWIKSQIKNRFSSETDLLFKAFANSVNQRAAADKLKESGWRVWQKNANMDDDIIQHSKADCGKDPNQTVLFLVTKDGDFSELANHLKSKGVVVYAVGPQDTSQKLVQTVGKKRWIQGLPS